MNGLQGQVALVTGGSSGIGAWVTLQPASICSSLSGSVR